MFDNIVTLSLNPALDVTLWMDELVVDGNNIVTEERYDAAGKAMNVSRTLRSFGVDSLAIVLAGKYNLYPYEERLISEGIRYEIIPVDGYIRENISIILPDKSVTRLLREGFTVGYETVEAICKKMDERISTGTLVVVSGQLPKGISPTVLKMICRRIHDLGGRIALDTSSISLEDLYEIRPWLVKPNYAEMCGYCGRDLGDHDGIRDSAREMNQNGVEHVLMSLGRGGILYSGKGVQLRVDVPEVGVVSSVGAGDCTMGGFIKAVQCGGDIFRCVSTAAASGTAACMGEGTHPPSKIAMANILQQLRCRVIEGEEESVRGISL